MFFEIKDLNVRYGGAQVLKDISLHVDQGEIVTIIGSNGAGKTTTLRTISGLKRPAKGKILYQGQEIHEVPPQDIVRMGIGHVTQGRDLFPFMTVLENLKLGAYLSNDKNKKREGLEKIFHIFPLLKTRRRQQTGTLSGGEQQMLAIGRALMGGPNLLLLDEPSIGLAPIVVREIGKVAIEINQMGTSILFVEQNARLALRLSDRGYVLESGHLVLEGNCEDLLDDERVKKAYLGQE
ncbi:MAG: ABC transporter ATP-binding protein [Planctomycetota bacterium]|jgi:branched-chain amino acid transport system ATP-binding protein